METGANKYIYDIDSDVHGEVLVPAIKQCIENVDVENGKMQIRLLEGSDRIDFNVRRSKKNELSYTYVVSRNG